MIGAGTGGVGSMTTESAQRHTVPSPSARTSTDCQNSHISECTHAVHVHTRKRTHARTHARTTRGKGPVDLFAIFVEGDIEPAMPLGLGQYTTTKPCRTPPFVEFVPKNDTGCEINVTLSTSAYPKAPDYARQQYRS